MNRLPEPTLRPLRLLAAPLAIAALLGAACVSPPREDVSRPNADDGLALEGHDPVSYFPEGGGGPREGRPSLTATHAGVTYRFASEANRERFVADPERYAPAYGGWCAWAVRDGDLVDVDPDSWVIQDGRLLLFYDGVFGDTRAMWQEDPASHLTEADRRWQTMTANGDGD